METFSALLPICAGNSPVPRYRAHYNVTVMYWLGAIIWTTDDVVYRRMYPALTLMGLVSTSVSL